MSWATFPTTSLRIFCCGSSISRGDSRAVVMVQREVADRVAAVPGSPDSGPRDYGLLSATAQYARVERVLTLPPSAFLPPPEVHSTVLRLTMRPRFAELDERTGGVHRILEAVLCAERKTLGKNLRTAGFDAGQMVQALKAAGIAPMARAEELGLEPMAGLWKGLRAG